MYVKTEASGGKRLVGNVASRGSRMMIIKRLTFVGDRMGRLRTHRRQKGVHGRGADHARRP